MLSIYDYATQPETDEECEEALRDPIWRLCNLYRILTDEGKDIRFRPNPPQMALLEEVFVNGNLRELVLKSRQIGFSTLIALIILDQSLFRANLQSSIVDQSQADASKKLDKIKFAYERLDPELNTGPLDPCSDKQVGFPNGSRIYAGMRARGGTNQILHISEWGPISANDGKRAQEIKTGALPTLPKSGLLFNESTFQGGRGGPFFEQVTRSMDANRTMLDCKMLFVPWQEDSRCVLDGDPAIISSEIHAYLDKLEISEKMTLSPGQRMFYYAKEREQGDDMLQEYPSNIEEALNAKVPGAIYLNYIVRAEAKGRITDDITYREGFPCYSAWDIGGKENQRVIIFQTVGNNIDILEGIEGDDMLETPAQWAALLRDRDYNYGGHFLPHDGSVYMRAQLEEAGMKYVVCLDKPIYVWDNINEAKSAFSRCRFHRTLCDGLLGSLKAFRSRLEPDGLSHHKVPVHNWASHYSTCFGYMHQSIREGRIIDRSAMPQKARPHHPPEVITGLARFDEREPIR